MPGSRSARTASTKGYGTYTLTAAGLWVYTLDNSNADVQARNVGQILSDTFTVTTVDGTSKVVIIIISGTNDAAVIIGETTGAVVEAGGVANGTPGTPTDTGDLNFTDVDDPNDAWEEVSFPTASTYGTFTLTAAGLWTYTLDDTNAAVQALNAGDTLIDTFTVATIDGTSQVVTITINGADDAAAIIGETTGTVVEAGGVANGTPGIPTDTGDLDADVDDPDAWEEVSFPTASTYGTFEAHRRRAVDLHAGRQQCGRAGAQCGRDADRHLHGGDNGRRLPGRDHHHQRRQRRGSDHRRRHRRGDRGRRRQ